MLSRVKGHEIMNITRIQEIKMEKLKMSNWKVIRKGIPRNDTIIFWRVIKEENGSEISTWIVC